MASGPKVLVCDDDDGIRGMLVVFLEAEGFEVEAVADGPSCLETVAENPPDVVVLDVMMPRMDGYQVVEVLRRSFSRHALKVVMLTARTSGEDALAGWSAGVDHYMTKPFDPDELLRLLHFLARTTEATTPRD
ncbi:MAG TPA: response regulator [Actinomycetes bacterium]|nr:response regulator [Actinomycetes bacterium]